MPAEQGPAIFGANRIPPLSGPLVEERIRSLHDEVQRAWQFADSLQRLLDAGVSRSLLDQLATGGATDAQIAFDLADKVAPRRPLTLIGRARLTLANWADAVRRFTRSESDD